MDCLYQKLSPSAKNKRGGASTCDEISSESFILSFAANCTHVEAPSPAESSENLGILICGLATSEDVPDLT